MELHPGREDSRALVEKSQELDPIQRALQENEDWYRDLVAHSHDLLCIHDLNGRFLMMNPAPARLLEYSVEEMLQIPMRELIDPEYRNGFDAYLRQIERDGEASGFLALRTRSGEPRIWQYHNTLRTEGVASPIVRGIAHDITAQRQSEKMLREAGENLLNKVCENERTIRELKLFRTLVDRSNDCIQVIDPETLRFLDANERACSDLGYSRAELLSLTIFDIDPVVTKASIAKVKEEVQKSGFAVIETTHRRKDGSTFPVELHMTRVHLDRIYVVAIARDLTERKRVEGRLREYERVVEGVEEVIAVVDKDYRYIIANRAFLEYRGLRKDQVIGHLVSEIMNPSVFAAKVKEKMDECFRGKVVQYDLAYEFPKLGRRNLLASYFPIEGPSGVDRIAMILQDITERKRAEAKFRGLLEASPDAMVVVNGEGKIVLVNAQTQNLFGFQREELINREIEMLIPERFHNIHRRHLLEFSGNPGIRETSASLEIFDLRKDKTEFPIEICLGPLQTEQGVLTSSAMRDVSQRKQTEVRLREYEKVVEGLEEMIVVLDRDHRYVLANRAYLNSRGLKKEQLIGRRIDEVANPESLDEIVRRVDECLQGKTVHYHLKDKYPVLGERDLFISYFPIEGSAGVDRIACVVQDITERKRSEENLKQAKQFSENLIQTANVIILSLDAEGNVTLFNRAAEEITGYTFSELRGKHWSTLVPKDRFPQAWEEFERLMAGKSAKTFENAILTKAGEERYIAWRNNQVRVEGSVMATISFGMDITESKRGQEMLKRSEQNYRLFVSQSTEGIFREDIDAPVPVDLPEDELIHHILHDHYMAECNDAMAAMYGLTSGEQMRGKRLTELLLADDPRNIELTREFVRSGFRVIDRESHEVDVHGNPKVFLNSMIGTVENGMLVRTWGIQRDITEKVRLEEARRKAEEDLRHNVERLQQVTEELRVAQEKLSEEKLYLEEAIDTELGFGEIVGRSAALKDVMEKVAKVARSDATVLLLGETGTGKELVARALHRLSKRQGNSFIKLNCAAIPSGLLESELFGHEKGAFTGAIARKLGRLELADKGTLFLDEIGEIPLSLQPKLLRVIQDQEFERLGGTQTLKVNFRLLAATNRDLLQSVKAREFRSDLYYRLNVFPIVIPPLRERREDIRPLIEHFVRKFSIQMKKSVTSIPSKTMEALVRWEWPGNIRELENFVERSVILTAGAVLQSPLSELQTKIGDGELENKDNLRDREREQILRALRDCHGKLGGPDGAAARLGLKRTTLQSKLDQLRIKPGVFRN